EFSELIVFGEHLLAFDDRTGLVCEIRAGHRLVPRQILMTGSGDEAFKGFKSEWATLKGDELIVGSHGKSRPEEWVKFLDHDYRIRSRNWHTPYRRIRDALGIGENGYVIHEAAEWHPGHARWYFFPRKISHEPFDMAKDEREKGGNTLISSDETFNDIRTIKVGERVPERGVSSFKFIPGHPDEFVGLKSVECGDTTATYLFCFDARGNVLQEDTYIGAYKCEGVAIFCPSDRPRLPAVAPARFGVLATGLAAADALQVPGRSSLASQTIRRLSCHACSLGSLAVCASTAPPERAVEHFLYPRKPDI